MLTLNFIRSRGYEYCCEDGKGGSIYIRNNENDITYYVVHGQFVTTKVKHISKEKFQEVFVNAEVQ